MNNDAPLYDFSILTQGRAMDVAFIKHMLTLFLNNMPETTRNLIKACEAKNWEEVHFNAHKMKAGIDTFNIHVLKPLIRQVEKKAKHIDKADVTTLQNDVQLIDHYIKKCIGAMQKELETL